MQCDFPDGDRNEEEKESHQCIIGIADKSFEQTIEEGEYLVAESTKPSPLGSGEGLCLRGAWR